MTLEQTLLTTLSFSMGFLIASILGARRAQLNRVEGYHLGVREGRRWARAQKIREEVGE